MNSNLSNRKPLQKKVGTSEVKKVTLSRQNTRHQPGAVGRGKTVDPDLNQPPRQIRGCPCLRRDGLAVKWKSVQT